MTENQNSVQLFTEECRRSYNNCVTYIYIPNNDRYAVRQEGYTRGTRRESRTASTYNIIGANRPTRDIESIAGDVGNLHVTRTRDTLTRRTRDEISRGKRTFERQ